MRLFGERKHPYFQTEEGRDSVRSVKFFLVGSAALGVLYLINLFFDITGLPGWTVYGDYGILGFLALIILLMTRIEMQNVRISILEFGAKGEL